MLFILTIDRFIFKLRRKWRELSLARSYLVHPLQETSLAMNCSICLRPIKAPSMYVNHMKDRLNLIEVPQVATITLPCTHVIHEACAAYSLARDRGMLCPVCHTPVNTKTLLATFPYLSSLYFLQQRIEFIESTLEDHPEDRPYLAELWYSLGDRLG